MKISSHWLLLTLPLLASLVCASSVRAEDAKPPITNRRVLIPSKDGDLPALVYAPEQTKGRRLVIWLTGFSGGKDSVVAQLKDLADHGYVAISFDPYQHGERRIEPQPELVSRVRGNIRRYFWPILAKTAEEVPAVIDWAIKELGVRKDVGSGGVSMGGDISVAAAGVDPRIRVVSACVAAPDWMRPGSFEPPGAPDAAAQADYDRRNPITHLDAYRSRPAIAFQSGALDTQVPAEGGERFIAALKEKIYKGHEDLLVVNLVPNAPHSFPPVMWEASLKWFQQHLGQP